MENKEPNLVVLKCNSLEEAVMGIKTILEKLHSESEKVEEAPTDDKSKVLVAHLKAYVANEGVPVDAEFPATPILSFTKEGEEYIVLIENESTISFLLGKPSGNGETCCTHRLDTIGEVAEFLANEAANCESYVLHDRLPFIPSKFFEVNDEAIRRMFERALDNAVDEPAVFSLIKEAQQNLLLDDDPCEMFLHTQPANCDCGSSDCASNTGYICLTIGTNGVASAIAFDPTRKKHHTLVSTRVDDKDFVNLVKNVLES